MFYSFFIFIFIVLAYIGIKIGLVCAKAHGNRSRAQSGKTPSPPLARSKMIKKIKSFNFQPISCIQHDQNITATLS